MTLPWNAGERIYDAVTRHFTSKDPEPGNVYEKMRVNPYVYAGNNPVTFVDPTGRSFMDDVGNAAGAVVDFTRGAVSATKNAIDGVTGTISRTVGEIRDTFHAIACDPVGYFNSLSISEKIIVGTVGGLAAEAAVKTLVGIIRGTTLESFMDEAGQMSYGDDVYKNSKSIVPEPLENHSTVVGRNGSLKAKGLPNTSVDLYSEDGRLLQRRFYGEDGKATMDVDFWHGNGDGTHTFPHTHIWDWTLTKPRQ